MSFGFATSVSKPLLFTAGFVDAVSSVSVTVLLSVKLTLSISSKFELALDLSVSFFLSFMPFFFFKELISCPFAESPVTPCSGAEFADFLSLLFSDFLLFFAATSLSARVISDLLFFFFFLPPSVVSFLLDFFVPVSTGLTGCNSNSSSLLPSSSPGSESSFFSSASSVLIGCNRCSFMEESERFKSTVILSKTTG